MSLEPEGRFHDQRTVYVLRLRAEPWVISEIRAMRALLKIALRTFGLRCLSVDREQR